MADFNKAFELTLGHEGGYANDPDDTGGETVFGVTRRDHGSSQIWQLVDGHKEVYGIAKAIPHINRDQRIIAIAKSLYKASYWDVNRLGDIADQNIAEELFDTGVNMGVGTAARFLQQTLNVTNKNQSLYPDLVIDGKIGPITISVVNKHPNKSLVFKVLNVLQGARYLNIMSTAPSQEKFALSWFSRVQFLRA